MLKAFRRNRHLVAAAMVVVLSALLFGCTPNDPQSTFDANGPVAESQLELFWIIFGAGVLVFVLVQGAMIYSLIKYRRRSNADMPEQVEGNSTIEFAWTAGPTALLIVIAIPTIFTIFDNHVSPDPAALTVDVVGHQWWFEFRYRHPDDPTKEIRTANDLHIPVNEVVNINLESVDVIHSFWVPKIAGKVDMVPSNGNTMWIQADRTGFYYGQCAEFCGVQHANMRFAVIVEPREDFDAWLMEQAAPAIDSPDPLIQQGKRVFLSAGCTACHQMQPVANVGDISLQGPDLAHLVSRTNFAGGTFDNRDENGEFNDAIFQHNLRTWLSDPESSKPGNVMAREAPPYIDSDKALSESELSALVAYLSSLD